MIEEVEVPSLYNPVAFADITVMHRPMVPHCYRKTPKHTNMDVMCGDTRCPIRSQCGFRRRISLVNMYPSAKEKKFSNGIETPDKEVAKE